MPPKKFNKDKAKLINEKEIEEACLCGDKNNNNYWFKYIIFRGKKYYLVSSYKNARKLQHLSYFCNKHRTIFNSKEFTEEGNKKNFYMQFKDCIYKKRT